MDRDRATNTSQVSSGLPGLKVVVTGHKDEKTTILASNEAQWKDVDTVGWCVPYTTSSFPVDLNSDADVKTHRETMTSGKLGIVNPGGTVMRICDLPPSYTSAMHRTQSLDYGVVLEGRIELILENGETSLLDRGDICVQRGTNHAWRNTSSTEWARMCWVLQESKAVNLGGEALKEELGHLTSMVPPSHV